MVRSGEGPCGRGFAVTCLVWMCSVAFNVLFFLAQALHCRELFVHTLLCVCVLFFVVLLGIALRSLCLLLRGCLSMSNARGQGAQTERVGRLKEHCVEVHLASRKRCRVDEHLIGHAGSTFVSNEKRLLRVAVSAVKCGALVVNHLSPCMLLLRPMFVGGPLEAAVFDGNDGVVEPLVGATLSGFLAAAETTSLSPTLSFGAGSTAMGAAAQSMLGDPECLGLAEAEPSVDLLNNSCGICESCAEVNLWLIDSSNT